MQNKAYLLCKKSNGCEFHYKANKVKYLLGTFPFDPRCLSRNNIVSQSWNCLKAVLQLTLSWVNLFISILLLYPASLLICLIFYIWSSYPIPGVTNSACPSFFIRWPTNRFHLLVGYHQINCFSPIHLKISMFITLSTRVILRLLL